MSSEHGAWCKWYIHVVHVFTQFVISWNKWQMKLSNGVTNMIYEHSHLSIHEKQGAVFDFSHNRFTTFRWHYSIGDTRTSVHENILAICVVRMSDGRFTGKELVIKCKRLLKSSLPFTLNSQQSTDDIVCSGQEFQISHINWARWWSGSCIFIQFDIWCGWNGDKSIGKWMGIKLDGR